MWVQTYCMRLCGNPVGLFDIDAIITSSVVYDIDISTIPISSFNCSFEFLLNHLCYAYRLNNCIKSSSSAALHPMNTGKRPDCLTQLYSSHSNHMIVA